MNTIENSLAREPSVAQEQQEAWRDRQIRSTHLGLLSDAMCVMRAAIEELQSHTQRLSAETGSHMLTAPLSDLEKLYGRKFADTILDVGSFWDDWINERLRGRPIEPEDRDAIIAAFRNSLRPTGGNVQ